MIPPLWLTIKILRPERRDIKIWLPLFLIWPIVLIFAIILFPFVLLFAIFQLLFKHHMKILLVGPYMYNVICKLRGLLVDVNSSRETVFVNFR